MSSGTIERPIVENDEYCRFTLRILRALGRRAGADIETLPRLANLQAEMDAVMQRAVDGCRADGHSWSEIARRARNYSAGSA